MRNATPVEKKAGASLWRLATGGNYRSCGLVVGMPKSTAVESCNEFTEELCRVEDNFIQFPISRAEVKAKINGFADRSKIPNIAGAIDGTHIKL